MPAAPRILWAILLSLAACCGPAFAQRAAHLRGFQTAGAYPASVTVSPLGTVVAKSADKASLSIFDGFERRDLSVPEENSFRAHLSRSGQIWMLSSDGLLLHHGGVWARHQLPEVRHELTANPIRQLRQISLLPAEINHVLILLPTKLVDYDAELRQARVLKFAAETSLGEFLEIQEGLDESIWISGALGVAHLAGSARRITQDTPWQEFVFPAPGLATAFQRPHEFPPGSVTLSAFPANSESSRLVVHLDGGQWSWKQVPGEKIRQAWRGWDHATWGYAFNALFRMNEAEGQPLRREPIAGTQYDMALETNGVFWIASSEGVIRHAPFLWRSRPDLEGVGSAVHSMVFRAAPAGLASAWLATPEGLVSARGREPRLFPWPEEAESPAPPRKSMFLLPDGRLLIGMQSGPFFFDPESGAFAPLPAPSGVQIRLLGELLDGGICAWFENPADEAGLDLRVFTEGAFVRLDLPPVNRAGAEISFIKEFSKGDLWLGTSAGLIRIRLSGGAVEFHGPEFGLPSEQVAALSAAGDNRLWCGTSSMIYEFRGQRWAPRLAAIDRVTSILPFGDSIWVGAASGAYRYLDGAWIPHGVNEGLPAGAVHSLQIAPGGQLWAATSQGVALFHPEADADPPRVFSPELPDAAPPSTVEPTLLAFRGQDKWDYTPASGLLFSYRLDEGGWTPFSNINGRVFQNLSSGSHILQVLSMDRNGNKSRNPAQIEFAVFAPWFQDPRLRIVSLCALALCLGLAGLAVKKHLDLKRSYAEVEKIVAQRTRELEQANQEILHSQKMRALGSMAAGIAHDFNNILSIIKGSAQIIGAHTADKEKVKTRVQRIHLVVEQGTAIVKALLGLGRMHPSDLAPCDPAELLRQTRKLLADRFNEAVQIEIDAAPNLPQPICSQDILQQMLLNLILNAVEAMGGEGLVRLTARSIAELPRDLALDPAPAPAHILLSVRDEGPGISAENLPRIFEPFFTTKALSTRRGTGLGLSMVYELAKGLGCGLRVETQEGAGSTFSILLPVLPAPSPEAPDSARPG